MSILTAKAKQKFLEITEKDARKGQGLRVIVRNGGTSQPEFALNFVSEDEKQDDDTVIDGGGIKVYVDGASAKFLDGATIDFIDALDESGFRVDAPNAGASKPSGPLAEAVIRVLDGGCQGCGMVNVTLKQGVVKVLFEEISEVTKVMDVTDHASGTNPYYQPGK